jgi:hypothetical protein
MTDKKQNQTTKLVRRFTWWKIYSGGALSALGVLFVVLYSISPENMFFAVLLIACLGGGGVLLFQGIKSGGDVEYKLKKQATGPVNAIILKPKTMELTWIDDPDGFPMTVKNNGKDWYLYIEKDGVIQPYQLPDSMEYYDPGEYANVTEMPAHKKLFERQMTLLEQLTPGFLAIGMIIVVVALIAIE